MAGQLAQCSLVRLLPRADLAAWIPRRRTDDDFIPAGHPGLVFVCSLLCKSWNVPLGRQQYDTKGNELGPPDRRGADGPTRTAPEGARSAIPSGAPVESSNRGRGTMGKK